jgi:cytoskeletal protein CcmA (bactofilin family)
MFNKTQDKPGSGLAPQHPTSNFVDPPADPAPTAQRRANKIPSVIAEDIVIEGAISGEGELHIDGTVKGDVRVARLSLGETGRIEGSATADVVEARGHIVGSVTAKQIRLFAGASVDGDLTHEQLAIEIGASFQGRSLKFKRPPEPKMEPKAEIKPQARLTPSSLTPPAPAPEAKPEGPPELIKMGAAGNG